MGCGRGVVGGLAVREQGTPECVGRAGSEHPDISHRDDVAAYVGLLAQGQSDYDHIEAFREDPFFQYALDLRHVPSSPTLRQRLQQAAAGESHAHWTPAIQDSRVALLPQHAELHPVTIGAHAYLPLDIDVSPFDNGKTKKEGVSRTYQGCEGFAPIFAY
jgi:hypothetical protein